MSKWRTLSNEEIIREFSGRRNQSPVIDELLSRLEKTQPLEKELVIDCPACCATVQVTFDDDGDVSEIEAKNV